jgi:type IV pilus biogenesis protein CpaD/CtpE
MNKIVVVALALSLLNCKQEPKNDVVVVTDYKTENLEVTSSVYPENITNILKAHGTLEAWDTNKTLAFTMKKEKGDELTITDLKK